MVLRSRHHCAPARRLGARRFRRPLRLAGSGRAGAIHAGDHPARSRLLDNAAGAGVRRTSDRRGASVGRRRPHACSTSCEGIRSMAFTRRETLIAGAALGASPLIGGFPAMAAETADLVLFNGRIATQDEKRSIVQALAIKDGRILATGSDAEMAKHGGERVDLKGPTVIPGLNDSHSHPIRGGLNYTLELRWDGVPSLADAMRMLREQVQRTPPNQWVRVVGGWSEFQFAEKRMPTIDELNAA